MVITRSKDSQSTSDAARMRKAIGAARHQHKGNDVEGAEAGPKGEH